MNGKTRIVMIGGFLGSGKTTLMKKAAELLTAEGVKVGMITNDQATALVDTGFLSQSLGLITEEVSGSCFCCNFPGLEGAIDRIAPQIDAGIILAEPVGSCTDLSATIVQTLKDRMKDRLVVSPMSVLADPVKLEDILNGGNAGLHLSSAYIVKKQFEEADYILINKIDTITAEKAQELKERATAQFPMAKVMLISGQEGTGVAQWLNEVTKSETAGTHLIDVDYDTYAEGEAVLGWLNTTVKLNGTGIDWQAFAESLLRSTAAVCAEINAPIGHVKLMVKGNGKLIVGNLTGGIETLSIRGDDFIADEVELTFNARAQMPPEVLETKTRELIKEACSDNVTFEILVIESLMPGRPNPTYRYNEIV